MNVLAAPHQEIQNGKFRVMLHNFITKFSDSIMQNRQTRESLELCPQCIQNSAEYCFAVRVSDGKEYLIIVLGTVHSQPRQVTADGSLIIATPLEQWDVSIVSKDERDPPELALKRMHVGQLSLSLRTVTNMGNHVQRENGILRNEPGNR